MRNHIKAYINACTTTFTKNCEWFSILQFRTTNQNYMVFYLMKNWLKRHQKHVVWHGEKQ